ncbi:MAG TPA: ABC transporter ATP-binding protein [Thermohalobaculum sp.]|nr:ABC transporter ATP-binding protein [Thermohalobaculum sp.]
MAAATSAPGTTARDTPLLEARNIVRKFGDFAANDDVSLSIRAGEKHALLGENGAGKSTLVKMIYGVMQPTAGAFFWQGARTVIHKPAEARALGIGMVFQHFSVFDALSVAENIALALPPQPMRALSRRIREVSEAYGLAIDPRRAVHTLSVGEKQRVEIIRCLLQDPKLLIMDEPTSVLTPQEAATLFGTLDKLAAEGCAILYISHKLDEVRALCDTATILRQGKVVATCDPHAETARSLAEMMVGSEILWVEKEGAPEPGPVRLRVDALDLPAASEFAVTLRGISLEVRGGEIVGIAGVAGEGQSELMEALTGEVPVARDDAIAIDGAPVGRSGPTRRRLARAAFVPEERNGHAAVADMTLPENVILSHHTAEGLARAGWLGSWLDFAKAADWAARVRAAFDVRAGAEDPVAGSLSGGNLQKFVVGREMLRAPGVLVVNQPTWGVDAGAAALIRRALIELAGRGTAVLVISQDLEEIFSICDRIAVIHHGRLSRLHPAAEMTPEKVGLLMGGARPEATEISDVEAA